MNLPPPFDLLETILVRGALTTIQLSLLGEALSLIVGLILGVTLLSNFKLVRGIARAYVEFFRGSSVLVQLFWIFYVLPFFGITLDAMTAAILAFGLNLGAYNAEVIRGAIQSVPSGQTEAAIALNMKKSLRMRRIIIPQAIRFMIPPLGNLFIQLIKLTSLAFFITVQEMTFFADNMRFLQGERVSEIFLMLALAYFMIAYPLTLGFRWLERRYTRAYTIGGR